MTPCATHIGGMEFYWVYFKLLRYPDTCRLYGGSLIMRLVRYSAQFAVANHLFPRASRVVNSYSMNQLVTLQCLHPGLVELLKVD